MMIQSRDFRRGWADGSYAYCRLRGTPAQRDLRAACLQSREVSDVGVEFLRVRARVEIASPAPPLTVKSPAPEAPSSGFATGLRATRHYPLIHHTT